MQVRVARVGKPHGIRGEVTVEVLTDAPEDRFVAGAQFATDDGALTVESARWNKGILLLAFDEVNDRNQAEELRGTTLLLDTDEDESDDDGWYEHELVDAVVRVGSNDGEQVGRVTGLQVMPAQDLLVVELADGREALIPLVEQMVPVIDIEAGVVVIDPPPGLLELNAPTES